MAQITLSQGEIATIDDEDYEKVTQYKWYTFKARKTTYACARVKQANGSFKTIMLHRHIMDAPDGSNVDHRDNDGLNNVRSNLRVCSHAENLRNRGVSYNNVSGYKGVYPARNTGRWRASASYNGRCKYLGTFDCKHEAARAYNKFAAPRHGEFSQLNEISKD